VKLITNYNTEMYLYSYTGVRSAFYCVYTVDWIIGYEVGEKKFKKKLHMQRKIQYEITLWTVQQTSKFCIIIENNTFFSDYNV
jgi:hypothetical protein